MNIDEAKASPELDAVVAEQVMGWKRLKDCPDGSPDCPGIYMSDDGELHHVKYDAWFSRDISAVWQVVRAMQAHSFEWSFSSHGPEEWQAWCYARINRADYNVSQYDAFANTLPLAICRVALKVVGGAKHGER